VLLMTRLPAVALLAACFASHPAFAQPPMPIITGGCPMEYCSLGEWQATRATPVLREPRTDADTAFLLIPGDSVVALSNRQQISRPGIVVFRRTHAFRVLDRKINDFVQLTVPAGDTVYVTAISSEMTDSYLWYRGVSCPNSSGLDVYSERRATDEQPYDVLSLPTSEWWVDVRDRRGQVGWVLNPWHFDGAGVYKP
jgi:hypothetical protein